MKILAIATSLLTMAASAFAQQAKPVWELDKNGIDPKATMGKVELKNGTVKLDGTNAFSLPVDILGKQKDFTIEFDVKPPADAKSGHNITLVSNTDEKRKTGIKLRYHPPSYDCAWIYTNDYQTVEYRGFLRKKPHKITIISKDSQLMMFRDGMLLASTGDFKPSSQPLIFGSIENKPTRPYELSNIKVYRQAAFPTGFDKDADQMVYYGGDQYFMQRVKLKNPKLPRILIIGDSISGGYRGFITKYYKGKANVDYWMIGYRSMNGKNSQMERALKGVLSNGPYNVVTFNFGLHYWTHKGRMPEDKLIPWMTKIVKLIKKESPQTTFIWIRTTPWRTTPETGLPSLNNKNNETIIKYNKVVDQIMQKNNVPEVDLYTIATKKLGTIRSGSKDAVHWPSPVSSIFADEIIKEINKRLPNK